MLCVFCGFGVLNEECIVSESFGFAARRLLSVWHEHLVCMLYVLYVVFMSCVCSVHLVWMLFACCVNVVCTWCVSYEDVVGMLCVNMCMSCVCCLYAVRLWYACDMYVSGNGCVRCVYVVGTCRL